MGGRVAVFPNFSLLHSLGSLSVSRKQPVRKSRFVISEKKSLFLGKRSKLLVWTQSNYDAQPEIFLPEDLCSGLKTVFLLRAVLICDCISSNEELQASFFYSLGTRTSILIWGTEKLPRCLEYVKIIWAYQLSNVVTMIFFNHADPRGIT